MIFKESSAITYALYTCVDEHITLENIEKWLGLLDREGFLYYKITDVTMCEIDIEYKEKGQKVVNTRR